MKAYLVVTSTIFGLLAIVHLWRAYAETATLLHDPWYIVITALAAALSAWGWRLVAAARPRPGA
jgi:hypothetical protein